MTLGGYSSEYGYTGAGAQYAARRPLCFGNKAPQPLNTKRGCYGQPFSGSHGGSQKMTAVASQDVGLYLNPCEKWGKRTD